MPRPIFCLMGPTASGKTAIASDLITRFPFEIISVDSAMIYKEMDIGTAKPSKQELEQTPHHLIDILEPPKSYSAAQFCTDVIKLIDAIYQRGKIPLLVGGTMMYFNALQQGLSALPQADEALRIQLMQEAQQQGWAAMHHKLELIDPLAAAKIHANDTQRIQRALEVFHLTGKPLSFFWEIEKEKTADTFVNLILFPQQRSWLHERIAARFEQMLAQGFLAEVESLLTKWQLPATCPAMRTVGYRQAIDFLAGNENYQDFVQKGIAATRQLAKRQLTWLRHWPEGQLFSCEKADVDAEIIALISEILDNASFDFLKDT